MNKIYAHIIFKFRKGYSFLVLCVLGLVLPCQSSDAQAALQEENDHFIFYQAIARNANGEVYNQESLAIRISLTSRDGQTSVFFQEGHSIQTSQEGLFQLFIGGGNKILGSLKEVPWDKENIYLSVEIGEEQKDFILASRTQMLTVPYAFVAEKAGRLTEKASVTLRDQNIHWTTTGNNDSRPAIHYMGTSDNEDLVIKTNNTEVTKVTKEGQFQFFSGVTGPDNNPDSYPVIVQGSKQGIYIKVNGSRSSANNFLTFADDSQVWGRVEGQTIAELTSSSSYTTQVALYTLQGVSLLGQIVAETAEAIGYAASVLAAGAAPSTVANLIIIGVESRILIVDAVTWSENLMNNIGVSFATGNGDYAEYVLRSPGSSQLFPGQVVGIKDGMVTLNTQNADYYRVVSTAPAVLGNMPQPQDKADFEAVAFMGQVPVNVAGAVEVGDFILPSGNNDGTGIAVHPEDMKIGDYQKIIGVAWTAADFAPLNLINVAIGINSNDLGQELNRLNHQLQNVYDFLDGKRDNSNLASVEEGMVDETMATKTMSDEAFDQLIDENAEMLQFVYQRVKEQWLEKHGDQPGLEHMIAFFDDPIPLIKKIRRDPAYFTQWALIDKKITK